MTAPAIAPAPTATSVLEQSQPVTAPVVEQQPQTTDPVAAAVQQMTPSAPKERPAEGETLQQRMSRIARGVSDEAKADTPSEPAVATEAPVVAEAVAPEAATPPQLVPSIEIDDDGAAMVMRARDPKTGQWSEMDQSRTYELSIKDKATGEERIYQKSLPELMRMAKRGVHLQQAEPELKYYRENAPQWSEQFGKLESEVNETRSTAERYKSLAETLLTADESEVVRMREQYASQFTPESENARLRAEIDRLKQKPQPQAYQPPAHAVQDATQTAAFAQRTAPVIKEVEGLVGREAAVGQLALFTLPLLVNGQIPPAKLKDVEAYIAGPYRQWAQSVAATKSSAQQQAQKELDSARAAQQRAQTAANAVGAATRPLGGIPSNAPVQLPPPKNREELIQRISRGKPSTALAG